VRGLLVVLFLTVLPFTLGGALRPKAQAAGEARGQLLVAEPELADPNFAHTVVLVLEHDETGALGLVVNRPILEVPARELLNRLGLEGEAAPVDLQLYFGGPVDPQSIGVVHSTDYHRGATRSLASGIAITSDREILADIATGHGPRSAILAFGYAGWAPGQLDAELQRGDWAVVPADPALVFGTDDNAKWRKALAARGVDL
jgi:putative transcriptional regulator